MSLRNGTVLAPPPSGRRRQYTITTPVRLNRRLSEGSMRTDRLAGRNRRRIRIGRTKFSIAKGKHDAVTEQTIDVAHKQQTKHEDPRSGVSGSINLIRLRRVLKLQSAKNKRFTSWKTLKGLLYDVLEMMAEGRTGLFLQNSVLVVYRQQFDWTTFHDGRVPCRPLALSTLENYTKDLWNHLVASGAEKAQWLEIGVQWLDSLVLPPCYYVYPDEFYEYI